jgi:hypothetical protein
MASPGPQEKTQKETSMKNFCLASAIQVAVLVWAGGILTAGWLGMIKNADTTFTAGIFTSILANFGVSRKAKDDDVKPPEKRTPPIR